MMRRKLQGYASSPHRYRRFAGGKRLSGMGTLDKIISPPATGGADATELRVIPAIGGMGARYSSTRSRTSNKLTIPLKQPLAAMEVLFSAQDPTRKIPGAHRAPPGAIPVPGAPQLSAGRPPQDENQHPGNAGGR